MLDSTSEFKSGLTIPILYGSGEKTVTLMDVSTYNTRSMRSRPSLIGFRILHLSFGDVILDIHYKEIDKITNISFTYPFVWGPFVPNISKDPRPDDYFKINQNVDIGNSTKFSISQNMELFILRLKIK